MGDRRGVSFMHSGLKALIAGHNHAHVHASLEEANICGPGGPRPG